MINHTFVEIIPRLIVNIALLPVIPEIFPNSHHLLCTWHINNNVLSKCKNNFDTKEDWETFFTDWKTIMYADSEDDFWTKWGDFSIKYNQHEVVEYLATTYITHASKFVRCFTNRVLHFNTTTTSRGEGGHAVLKRHLGSSTGDLKTVVDQLDLLLQKEYTDFKLNLDVAKKRYPLDLNKPIFQQIRAYVTPHAIRKINAQYELLTERPTALPPCTKTFTTSVGLPCSHKIQERLYAGECLLLEDVHLHWRFHRPPPTADPHAANSVLTLRDPEIVRTRGRPQGAENISRREQAFENSTSRQPSQFEHVLMETAASDEAVAPEIQRVINRADPAPGRGRGDRRGRGSRGGRSRTGGQGEGRVATRGGRRGRSAVTKSSQA